MASIHSSCRKGDAVGVLEFLKKGIDVNSEYSPECKKRPLHDACQGGSVKVVQLLLDWKADTEACCKGRCTPFHYASFYGHEPVVRLLLDNGADMKARNDRGRIPLHNACLSGHEPVVKQLLDNGADIEARDDYGETPLHFNCYKNLANTGILKLLLGRGANIQAENLQMKTPLHIACCEGLGYAVQMLVESGADTEVKTANGKNPVQMCPSDEVKTCLRRAIEERRYLVTVSRFADCIRVARMDSIALATPEFKPAVPDSIPTGSKNFLAYIVNADACYKHILQVRQIREPVIELVMQCCAVLRDVRIGAVTMRERDDLKRAETALATFDTLQTQIRSGKETVSDVISERNCMRQRCLAQIETALQNRPIEPRPEIGVRAAEALSKLRKRPPVPNLEPQYVRDDEDLCRLCKDACIAGETFAAVLGHNTSQRKTCDMVADNAQKMFTGMLFRGYEYESADEISKQRCLELCVAGLAEELAFQKDSAENVTKASILFGFCVRLETALDTLVRQSIKMDASYRCLVERRALLSAGLKVPDAMEIEILREECTNNTRVRKRWDAQIVLADNEIEEARLREEFGVWQQNTRRRERAVGQEVAAWLQFAGTHYPELLQNANMRSTFTGKYELECAAQGILRRNESVDNYRLVRLLSDKKGRPVRLATDFEGKHVVLKSYSLTTSSHFSHFMRTCSKLGALRGVINIIPISGVFTEDQWGHVLMHYYSGGDLAAWINGHPKRDPKLCLRIAHQVVAAIGSLHTRDIVHCDLEPENIFLTSKLEAVLGDFDDVRDADCTITTAGVTRKYEAPEIRCGLVSRFDKSADVYSLGLVLKELFSGVSISDTFTAATDTAVTTLVAQMTKERPTERPTLPEVTAMPMFNEQSARLCGICCEAYITAESLICRNGHVTCNGCVNDWLRFDLTNSSFITRNAGLLPCSMQMNGCEKVWEPKVYAAHVEQSVFDEAMCLVNKPKVREELLIEQEREAAQDREFHHIADQILILRCPELGHVLDESFTNCFSLTCDACPRGSNEFCAFCWKGFGRETHAHVLKCPQNPNPGRIYNALDIFYKIKREERSQQLKKYWDTIKLDEMAKQKLAERVQPLLNQLKPEGTYKSLADLVG